MARLPRYHVPGQPQHVTQRGNDRMPIFRAESDFQFFATCLQTALERHRCALHAYVFMSNHVHLLVTPDEPGGIGRAMQSLGRRYVEYFNRRYHRTGTLWEGRYRATVVDSDRYYFACTRYIEQNPVRAGMTTTPAHYAWSSYRANALGIVDPLVTPHPLYTALGRTPGERLEAYRALADRWLDEHLVDDIRYAANKAWGLGGDEFNREITRIGRRATPLRRPRDPKGV